MKPTILVVDDEQLVRWSLRERLEEEGFQVEEADTGARAVEMFEQGLYDLVLLDYCLPDGNGIDLLRKMLEHDPDPPIVMMTAHSSVEMAVEAMRLGAYHYTRKPFTLDEVCVVVNKALETTRLRREVRRLLARENELHGFSRIIGESDAMQRVKETLRKIAVSPASTVLITGESGTGKDVAARTIHSQSDRRDSPFMNITCSALPETLLESELFGHERGAFTDAKQQKKGLLEQADGGTVFLDEIGEMAPSLQAKLLRFLEERAFRRVGGNTDIRPDVRVLAATHVDLKEAIKDGGFRSDLYYRLAVLHVRLPALRERRSDIELLVQFFVDSFNREFKRNVRGLSAGALRLLENYPWPGNVRELKNTIERGVLLCDSDRLDVDDFRGLVQEKNDSRSFALPPEGLNLRDLERELVIQALEKAGGNQTRAADLLGLTRDQIRYRIAKFKLGDSAATLRATTR